ncbi:MAG: hypothetical protein GX868_15380, partial [Actinobacteria bacterium]|nr:hypothetical protein [Actinomycetota bacterium]
MTVDRNRQASNGRGQPTGGRRRLLFRRSRRLVSLAVAGFVVYIVGTFIQVLVVSTWDESAEASGVAEAAIVLGAAQYNGRP